MPVQRLPSIEVADLKSNPMFAALAVNDIPQPRSMPRNYRAYAQEGYRTSDTLYKCVNYLITNGAAIPPVLYTDRTMSKTIDGHPLLDKLARPNAEWSGVYFRKSVLGFFNVTGNAFLYAIRKAASGPPDELWTLEPEKVTIVPTATRGIDHYEYEPFGRDKPIDPRNIGHLKTWAPDDPLWGLSPVEVAALLIDQQTAAKKWNLALLQNMAKPPGAWILAQILSPNDRQKLKKALQEELSGYQNAGKAPLLDGGLSWQSTGLPPSEMDWLNSMKYNGGGIANILNMPPQLIGDTSSTTYDNMKEAKAASYTEAIFPQNDEFYDLLNMWLVPMYPDLCDSSGRPVAYLYYDKTTVEVVQEVIQASKTARAQRAFQNWAAGSASSITLNEARTLQDLPSVPGGDVFRFGAVLVQQDELDKYAEQSLQKPAAPPAPVPENELDNPPPGQPADGGNTSDANTRPDNTKPDANGNDRGSNGSGKSAHPLHRYAAARATKALDLSTAEQKAAYLASVEELRTKWEEEAESRLQDYFTTEKEAVIKKLHKALPTATDEDHLENLVEEAVDSQDDDLTSLLVKLYQDVASDVGGAIAKDLKSQGARHVTKTTTLANLFNTQTIQYLLQLAGTKVSQINQTTLDLLRQALADGVDAGESIPQLAKRIDTLYLQQIIPNRSTVIARTEVVAASNWGAVQAAKQSGLTLNKVWLATADGRTRPDHADADGQEVAMDEPFEVGGYQLMQPGDNTMGAPASQLANCRCTVFFKRVQVPASTDDESDDDEQEKRARRADYSKFVQEVVLV